MGMLGGQICCVLGSYNFYAEPMGSASEFSDGTDLHNPSKQKKPNLKSLPRPTAAAAGALYTNTGWA